MRALAEAVADLVAAAGAGDAHQVEAAVSHLATLDPEQANQLLAIVVRRLLEETHLDGLSGDDIALVLEGCLQRSAPWYPDADPGILVVVLTGALGIIDPEEDEPVPPSADEIARHAGLVVADLLDLEDPPRALDPHLDAAVDEVERAQTVELP